jgi:hypothetical protein
MRSRAVILAGFLVLTVLTPIAAIRPSSASANHETLWGIYSTIYEDGDGLHYVGYLESYQHARVGSVVLTVDWPGPGLVIIASETVALDLQHVVNGGWIPFHVLETEDVSTRVTDYAWVTIESEPSGVVPVPGLDVEVPVLAGSVATGVVTNESVTVAATGVVVHGGMLGEDLYADSFVDTASSAVIDVIAPGESVPYTITFDADAPAGTGARVVAETTGDPYMTSWNNFFTDAHPLHYGRTEIIYLADEGITLGCGGERFCPHRLVTRAEVAVFLDRALELPDSGVDAFTDDTGSFAEQAINDAAAAGLVTGCAPDFFCPEDVVTRGQMAKMLVLGYDIAPAGDPDHFTDDDGSFSEPYNDALFEAGVTGGCSRWAPWYCPDRALTRLHTALLLHRSEHLAP